jgi:hypothetical protein
MNRGYLDKRAWMEMNVVTMLRAVATNGATRLKWYKNAFVSALIMVSGTIRSFFVIRRPSTDVMVTFLKEFRNRLKAVIGVTCP